MRKLMWFTLGFGAACALCVYFGLYLWLAIAVLLLTIGAMIGAKWCKAFRIPALSLLGALVAFVWFGCYQMLYLQPLKDMDGQTAFISARASDYSYETDYGSAVEAELYINRKKYNVLVYLNDTVTLVPGDWIDGEFRLRYTLGGLDPATYHRG